MSRSVMLIIKDTKMTQFMQRVDTFPRDKFIGLIQRGVQAESHQHLSASEGLTHLTMMDTDNFATVGVIIPDADAAFVPGHNTYSNGNGWCTVADLCSAFRSTLTEKQDHAAGA